MTERKRLPNRRCNESFAFALDGLCFTATVSWFADGRIAELFLNNYNSAGKALSPVGAALDLLAGDPR
jgi:hypothetical protein